MSKTVAIGAACTATVAAAGAAYYVSPVGEADLATPPVLVSGTPEQALDRLRRLSLERYIQHMGGSSRNGPAVGMSMRKDPDRPDSLIVTVTVDSDRVVLLHATAVPVGAKQTAVDITAEVPDSRFSKNPALHPYDFKVIAAYADFAATDYVASMLNGRRMASAKELGDAMVQRIGFDEQEKEAFGKRVGGALEAAYGRRRESGWVSDGYDPTPRDRAYLGSDPTYEAERAAEGATEAAEDAARAAQEAYEASRGSWSN